MRHNAARSWQGSALVFSALGDEVRLGVLARLCAQGPLSLKDAVRLAAEKHPSIEAGSALHHASHRGLPRLAASSNQTPSRARQRRTGEECTRRPRKRLEAPAEGANRGAPLTRHHLAPMGRYAGEASRFRGIVSGTLTSARPSLPITRERTPNTHSCRYLWGRRCRWVPSHRRTARRGRS